MAGWLDGSKMERMSEKRRESKSEREGDGGPEI